MPGFISPSILFVNSWDAPERAYMQALAKKLQDRSRFVLPLAGSFSMASAIVHSGWAPSKIEASDVSLFSSVLGYLLAGKDLAGLDVRIDGEPLDLTGSPTQRAAAILYAQLQLRFAGRPQAYYQALAQDIEARRDNHLAEISKKLDQQLQQLRGLSYRPLDVWAHLDEVASDPSAVVHIAPPAVPDKFYDTGGRLTWAAPPQEKWTPADAARLMQRVEGSAALVLLQQRAPVRKPAHEMPVYARQVAAGENLYILANRPADVLSLVGLKVAPRRLLDHDQLSGRIIPPDYIPNPASDVQVVPATAQQAAYYKDLWLHRLKPAQSRYSLAVYIDGYLAGIAGYGMLASATTLGNEAIFMVFSLGPAHVWRLTRLIVELTLQRKTLEAVVPRQYSTAIEAVHTSELTPYPETKEYRGLMKLVLRTPDPKRGYRLSYEAPLGDADWQQVLRRWLDREGRYQKGPK